MGVRYHFLVPIHWPKPWTHPRGPSFALVPLQTAAPRLRSGRRRCRPRRPSPPPRSPTLSPPPVPARPPSRRRLRHTRLRTLPVRRRCTGPSTSLFHHRAARRVAYESFDRSHAAPPDPTVPAAPTIPAGIALASIGASAATGATASAAAGAPAAAAPAAAPMSSSLSSEVS